MGVSPLQALGQSGRDDRVASLAFLTPTPISDAAAAAAAAAPGPGRRSTQHGAMTRIATFDCLTTHEQ